MDRIQIGAIALAAVLLVGWALTLPEAPPPAPQPEPGTASPGPDAPQPGFADVPAPPRPASTPHRPESATPGPAPTEREAVRTTLENDALRLVIHNRGPRFESIELPRFRDRVEGPAQPVQLVTDTARGTGLLRLAPGNDALAGVEAETHEVLDATTLSVRHRVIRDGVEITHDLRLDEQGYGAELRLGILNRSGQSVVLQPEYVWFGRERETVAPDHFQNYQLVAMVDGDLDRMPLPGIHSSSFLGRLFGGGAPTGVDLAAPVEWVGIESQYFLLAAIPENSREATGFQRPVGPDEGAVGVRYPRFEVPAGRQLEQTYRLYLGPKIGDEVSRVDARLSPSVNVGWSWVRPLVNLFAWLLKWTYDNVVGNYGVAIILLTILLRLATFPLTQRSMKSMKKMGVIAPEMKQIQETHKGSPEKIQAEMMALYKRTGINPATALGGGCLPMLLQMPFMLALYFALQGTIELRHAPFLGWINDLSAPENFFSIAGIPIRPLPLLMGASMLAQQWLTPATGDPQQRKMMMWMNVAFIFLFYQFPSGLVLYWFVSNLLGIAQQYLVNRGGDGTPAASAEPAKA